MKKEKDGAVVAEKEKKTKKKVSKKKNEVAKKKDGRGSKGYLNSPFYSENANIEIPGKNTKIASAMLEFMSWGEVDKSDVQAMEARFLRYIQYCAENDLKIGNQMAYLAVGISVDDAFNWTNGGLRTKEHSNFIKKVKKFCASYREASMGEGTLNPVTGIFWQKNYDGLTDKQEVVLTPNNPLGQVEDPEAIAEKYKQLPDDE